MVEETNNSAESGAQGAPAASAQAATVPATSVLASLTDKVWWRNAVLSSLTFSRYCIFPAVLWLIGGCVMLVGVSQSVSRIFVGGVVSLEQVVVGIGLFFLTAFVTIALIMWGLGVWLVRLTAFVRSFMELPMCGGRALGKDEMNAAHRKAFQEIVDRKSYLAKFWLYITLFLLVPAVTFVVLGLVKAFGTPAMVGAVLYSLPNWVDVTIMSVMAVLAVLLTEISFVALVVSANSSRRPIDAAKQSMVLSFQFLLPGALMSIIIVVLSTLISSPQMLMQMSSPAMFQALKNNLPSMLLENLWQSVTSVFLLSFTSAPFCELLRGRLD